MASGFPRALYRFRFVSVVLHIGGKVKRSLVIMYPYYELYDTNVDVCFSAVSQQPLMIEKKPAEKDDRSRVTDARHALPSRSAKRGARLGAVPLTRLSGSTRFASPVSPPSSLRPSLPILHLLALLLGETRSGAVYVVGQQRPKWRRP